VEKEKNAKTEKEKTEETRKVQIIINFVFSFLPKLFRVNLLSLQIKAPG
jgi:hypothetical protein